MELYWGLLKEARSCNRLLINSLFLRDSSVISMVVAVVWTTLLLFTTWAYACKMAQSVSGPSLYSTIASHLTEGSHIFSFDKSRLTPLHHRHRVWSSVFLLLLMETQVLRRLIETIYTFKYSSSARMHVFGYLTGLFFYTTAPLSLCSTLAPEVFRFAAVLVAEFIVKGKRQMPEFEFEWLESLNPVLKLRWYQWIGSTIFMWGWMHQRSCHAILGALREHAEQSDGYVIPHGDWFEIVSSPTIWLRLLYMLVCWCPVEEQISPYGCFLHLWWQIWYLQLQKLLGGIFVNLIITQATDMRLFHVYISTSCINGKQGVTVCPL